MIARSNLPGWLDKDIVLLALSMFFRRASQGFLQIVRAIYLAIIGFDPLTIGFMTGFGSAVSIIESTLFGVLSDRYGRKLFLFIGNLMSVARFLLYALSRDFWILLIAQGIGALGEGEGAGQPVVSGYISDKIVDGTKRTRTFSTLAITNALGSTIGSLLAALPEFFKKNLSLNEADAYILLFWIGFLFNLISLITIILIREPNPGEKPRRQSVKSTIKSPQAIREITLYSLVRSTDGLAMGFVSSLAPLYLHLRFNADSEDLAPIYAAARFIPIPLYLTMPLLVERFGYVKPLIVARAASGLSSLLIAFALDFRLASSSLILYMVLVETVMPIRQAFATEIASASSVGSLVGISNSLRTLLRSITPVVTGFFFQISQFHLPYILGSSLFFLNSFQFYKFYSKKGVTRGLIESV